MNRGQNRNTSSTTTNTRTTTTTTRTTKTTTSTSQSNTRSQQNQNRGGNRTTNTRETKTTTQLRSGNKPSNQTQGRDYNYDDYDFEGTVNNYVKRNLNRDGELNNENIQDWLNDVTGAIIKDIDNKKLKAKVLVNGVLKNKGKQSLSFVNGQLWDTNTDGIIKIPIDTPTKNGFIYVYVITEPKAE